MTRFRFSAGRGAFRRVAFARSLQAARVIALGMIIGLTLVDGGNAIAADDWPQFRGPDGDGRAKSKKLPVTWNETNGVRWKTPIHGRGWSSPVIGSGQIWLTTASEDGRELAVVCVDQKSGRVLHDLKLFQVEKPQFAHKFNTYASPTPVLDGNRLYVTWGAPATACLETKSGKVLWERRDLECNHYRGAGSSPILHGGLLFMNFDGSDQQFVIALDARDGRTVWQQKRSIDFKDLRPDGKPDSDGDWRKAFATPHVARLGGQWTLISQGAKAVYGYEPRTGKELWRVEERQNHSASARPVVGRDVVYINSGWSSGQLLAIRPGRQIGAVLDANVDAGTNASTAGSASGLQVLWKVKRNVPKKPSMLLVDDLLFAIDDGGIASCLEAKTGQEIWRERLGGNFSASPLEAGGRLYCANEEGKVVVVAADRQFAKLAENQLGDGFMASPAVSGDALYLRSRTHLYRVEAP
jgi:outer membrane protein assembly factor BamB